MRGIKLLSEFSPELKLIYLIALVAILSAFPHPGAIVGLLLLQIGLTLSSPLGWPSIWRVFKRLAFFFIVIGLSYAFVSVGPTDRWTSVAIEPWKVPINLGGLSMAMLMCLRVFVLILASVWVQESGKPGDFVRALQRFRVPPFMAASINGTIQLVSGGGRGEGRGGGDGSGRGEGRRSRRETIGLRFDQLRRGDFSFITDLVEGALERARQLVARDYPDMDRGKAKDIAVIVGLATAIMGTKAIQVLPGLPVAPGHKNVLIIPFLLLAAKLTRTPFGGLWTGLTAGAVSVLSGYGKFGIFEIAHFAVPGLMADVLLPLAKICRPVWLRFLQFGMIGAILGAGRFAANFLMILLAGAPQVAFAVYLPMLFSQVLFGALSAFASLALLDFLAHRASFESEHTAPLDAPPLVELQSVRRAGAGSGGGGMGRRSRQG